MAHTYVLGAVKPFVKDAAQEIGDKFDLTTIYGWRATSVDMTGHPAGLAVDLVVGTDKAKGDAIASYIISNSSRLDVKYICWQQRIWQPSKGWSNMEYRPGTTAGYDPNHMHHVHLSVNSDVDDGRHLMAAGATTSGGITGGTTASGADTASGSTNVDPGPNSDSLDPLISGTGNPLAGITAAFDTLTSGDTWRRVLYVVGGIYMVTVGVLLLTKDLWAPAAKTAAVAAMPGGAVVKGATAAAGAVKRAASSGGS